MTSTSSLDQFVSRVSEIATSSTTRTHLLLKAHPQCRLSTQLDTRTRSSTTEDNLLLHKAGTLSIA